MREAAEKGFRRQRPSEADEKDLSSPVAHIDLSIDGVSSTKILISAED